MRTSTPAVDLGCLAAFVLDCSPSTGLRLDLPMGTLRGGLWKRSWREPQSPLDVLQFPWLTYRDGCAENPRQIVRKFPFLRRNLLILLPTSNRTRFAGADWFAGDSIIMWERLTTKVAFARPCVWI